jgi:hypothetical protein
MTRKDYVALSAALRLARPSTADLFEQSLYDRIVMRLAIVFAADNVRFDRQRFIDACRSSDAR